MVATQILSIYSKISGYQFEKKNDDDLIDKFFRKYAVIGLIILASVVGINQLVGEPIKCWCPKEYSDDRCNYGTSYCYIISQYVPPNKGNELPSKTEVMKSEIMYYQWVPYIFLLQAILLYLPSLIWGFLSTRTGYDLRNYVNELNKEDSIVAAAKSIKYVAAHIHSCLAFRRNYKHRGMVKKVIANKLHAEPTKFPLLTISYLFIKILYILIAFGQIFLLDYWLNDARNPSIVFWHSVFGGPNWSSLERRFPRMTLCRLEAYLMFSEKQPQWLQCTLPINLFIEKFYVGIWFALRILIVLGIISMMPYMLLLIQGTRRSCCLKRYFPDATNEEIESLDKNTNLDTKLIIHLLGANTNKLTVIEVLKNLNTSINYVKKNDDDNKNHNYKDDQTSEA